MNEPLPYDDELRKGLNDLPLPNADKAWEDMQRRLAKDDKDRPVLPPALRGCALLALVLLIAGLALFILNPFQWRTSPSEDANNKLKQETPIQQPTTGSLNLTSPNKDSSTPATATSSVTETATTALDNRPGTHNMVTPRSSNTSGGTLLTENSTRSKRFTKNNAPLKKQRGISMTGNGTRRGQQPAGNTSQFKKGHVVPRQKIEERMLKSPVAGEVKTNPITTDKYKEVDTTKAPIIIAVDDTLKIIVKDSIKNLPLQSAIDTNSNTQTKQTAIAGKKKIYFSAGIGEQQMIPVAGQKSNTYNAQGRKNSLGDYIPSVYFRMHTHNKWFLQSTFRYGAPQYNREVVFAQQKTTDSFNVTTTFNSSLKKTFYHQLPVSFNYFILPGLSAGAGISINKFASAIVQQDRYLGNTGTPNDTLLSSVIEKARGTDTNFVKVYLQGQVEAQYQWRRFSGGVRYSFGLQPYLKFQLGGGQQQKESNRSLQLFIQYELWKSRKAPKK